MATQSAQKELTQKFVDGEVRLLDHELDLLTEAFRVTNDYRRDELQDVKIVKHLEQKILEIRSHLKSVRKHLSHTGYAKDAAKALMSAHHEIETLKLLENRFEKLIEKSVADEKCLLGNLRNYREELELDKVFLCKAVGVGTRIHGLSVDQLTQEIINNAHAN